MNEVKNQVKKMYILLGIMFVLGIVIIFCFYKQGLLSFVFGSVISAINLYLTYFAFNLVYAKEQAIKFSSILVGPLPKLLLIILGSLICYNFSVILPIVPFLIGVCLYAFTYLLFGATDFFKSKK